MFVVHAGMWQKKLLKELPIKEDNKKSVYWDVERANGPWDADPINIGLVKMSDRDNTIVDRLEIFVWTEYKIFWSQGHKITKNYRDKTMAKSEAAVNYLPPHVSGVVVWRQGETRILTRVSPLSLKRSRR